MMMNYTKISLVHNGFKLPSELIPNRTAKFIKVLIFLKCVLYMGTRLFVPWTFRTILGLFVQS